MKITFMPTRPIFYNPGSPEGEAGVSEDLKAREAGQQKPEKYSEEWFKNAENRQNFCDEVDKEIQELMKNPLNQDMGNPAESEAYKKAVKGLSQALDELRNLDNPELAKPALEINKVAQAQFLFRKLSKVLETYGAGKKETAAQEKKATAAAPAAAAPVAKPVVLPDVIITNEPAETLKEDKITVAKPAAPDKVKPAAAPAIDPTDKSQLLNAAAATLKQLPPEHPKRAALASIVSQLKNAKTNKINEQAGASVVALLDSLAPAGIKTEGITGNAELAASFGESQKTPEPFGELKLSSSGSVFMPRKTEAPAGTKYATGEGRDTSAPPSKGPKPVSGADTKKSGA